MLTLIYAASDNNKNNEIDHVENPETVLLIVYSVSILTGVGSIKQKDKEPLFDVGSVLIYLVVPFLQLVVQSIFEIPEKNPIFDFINPIFSDHPFVRARAL